MRQNMIIHAYRHDCRDPITGKTTKVVFCDQEFGARSKGVLPPADLVRLRDDPRVCPVCFRWAEDRQLKKLLQGVEAWS